MTHCSTHHAFPVPLSSSPAARAVCCPPGRARSPSSSSCTARPRAGRSPAPRLVHLPSPLPATQHLEVLFSAGAAWQRRAALALGSPRRAGSQESGIPAVPGACCRISGPAPAAHRADPHREGQRSPQDLSFSRVHQLTPTHSPGRAPRSPPCLSFPSQTLSPALPAGPQGVGAPGGATRTSRTGLPLLCF